MNLTAEQILIYFSNANIKLNQTHVHGHNINYITAGSGQPVILIHGTTLGWGQWYKNISNLAKYYQVIAIDLPGAGKSTPLEIHKENPNIFVEVLHDFITTKNLQNVSVIGHSFGAWITLQLAVKYNDLIDKAIIVNPFGLTYYIPPQHRLLSLKFLARFLSKTTVRPHNPAIKKFLESVLYNKSAVNDVFVNYVIENIKDDPNRHPFIFMSGMMHNFRLRTDTPIKDLERISQPILTILGKEDPMTNLNQILKEINRIPSRQYHILSKNGHAPFLENPETFNQLVTSFIN